MRFGLGRRCGFTLGILFSLGAAFCMCAPDSFFIEIFPDDAFFYMKTAVSMASGKGMTFDGITRTNGFHYGWLLLLTAVRYVVSFDDPITFLRIACTTQLSVALSAGWLLVASSPLKYRDSWLMAFLAAFVVVASMAPAIGMEVTLLVASFAFLAYGISIQFMNESEKIASGRIASLVVLAAASFSIVMARVDAILILVVLSASLVWKDRRTLGKSVGLGIRVAATMIGAGLLAFSFISTYNLVSFGHLGTISSYLKFYPQRNFPPQWLTSMHTESVIRYIGSALLSIPAIVALVTKSPKGWLAKDLAVAANLYVILYIVLLVFAGTGANFSWYYGLSTIIPVASFAALIALRKGPHSLESNLFGVLLACLSLVIAKTSISQLWKSFRHEETKFLTEMTKLRDFTTASDRIFLVDQSGRIGYFSQRIIINGDGLTNNWDYQIAIRNGTLKDYFTKMKINWILSDPLSSSINAEDVTVRIPGWRGDYFAGGRVLGSFSSRSAVLTLFDGQYSLIPIKDFTWF